MNFSLLLRHITPHRPVLLAIIALSMTGAVTALAQPWLAGRFTEHLLQPDAAQSSPGGLLALWALLIVLRALLGFGTQYLVGSTGEKVTADLRTRLFEHLQALPLAYHHEHGAGKTLALLANDAEQISRFVSSTAVQLLPLAFTFLGALAVMLLIDPAIATATTLLLPVFVVCLKVAGRRIRPLSRAWVESYGRLMAFASENLSLQAAIKSFSRAPYEDAAFQAHNEDVLALSRRRIFIQSILSPATGLLAGLGILLLLWLGGLRIASGTLAPADMVSLLLYTFMLVQPLRGLANIYGSLQLTRGAAERIIEFLNQQPEPDDTGKNPLAVTRGQIRFSGIDFHYPGGKTVLRDLSLDIGPGETVAITGPNGAGKSTLSYLLLRFADPDAGSITIDGVNLKEVTLASLRRQVGIVAQHTLLANGSIRQNIAYARPLATQGEVEAVARLAQAHEFITSLPQGYDTQIGEQGLRLSGGQRQRIALARALLPQPPVLILDEATSMFDPEGEAAFIEAFKRRAGGTTVILISHRPASLTLANRVIQLGNTASSHISGGIPGEPAIPGRG